MPKVPICYLFLFFLFLFSLFSPRQLLFAAELVPLSPILKSRRSPVTLPYYFFSSFPPAPYREQTETRCCWMAFCDVCIPACHVYLRRYLACPKIVVGKGTQYTCDVLRTCPPRRPLARFAPPLPGNRTEKKSIQHSNPRS